MKFNSEAIEQIKKALVTLGVKGTVTVNTYSFKRYTVYVDDRYFGIFDISRDTFVD